ncbi:MAG: phosphatidylglycerophosphatase A [Limisphaerales bacterium]
MKGGDFDGTQRGVLNRGIVFVAQGFGSGWIPKGPGTAGTLVGFAWTWLLMWPGNAVVFWLGACAGVGLAVWICGRAERLLGEHDPGSIVLDEIVAVPLCFGTLLTAQALGSGFEGPSGFVAGHPWWLGVVLFVGFRFFDIAKPWPVKQVQALPSGWGVVADDVLAAVWVNVPCLLALGWVPGCCGDSSAV